MSDWAGIVALWVMMVGGGYWLYQADLLGPTVYLLIIVFNIIAYVWTWRRTRYWSKGDYRSFWRDAYGPSRSKRRR